MNCNVLIDAIGDIDDKYILLIKDRMHAPIKKIAISLVAAVLLFSLFVGTAMALSEDFREIIFYVFNITTHETPLMSDEESDNISDEELSVIKSVNIDGKVDVHYFSSEGLIFPLETGFYTCSADLDNTVPISASFWQVDSNGLMKVEGSRVDFVLTHKGREFRIVFDHAIVNGKQSIKIWPQGLNDNPVGYGWNIEPIGERQDVVLLSVPVRAKNDYTHDILLLNLVTLNTEVLIDSDAVKGMDIYGCRVTADMNYALLAGIDRSDASYGYMFFDLTANTAIPMNELLGKTVFEPFFLDEENIVFCDMYDDGRFDVIRYNIPTGEQMVIVKYTCHYSDGDEGFRFVHKSNGYGRHGLLYTTDRIYLIDLSGETKIQLPLDRQTPFSVSENTDGNCIFFGFKVQRGDGQVFVQIGLLDKKSGILKILTRDVESDSENLRGWINGAMPVITSPDGQGGYFVYVYDFN